MAETNSTKVLKARQKAEKEFLDIMKELDKEDNGYNYNYWKKKFASLSNKEFIELMKNWNEKFEENIYFQLNTLGSSGGKDPTNEDIIRFANKRNIELKEYVIMPEENKNFPELPAVTKNKMPIFILPVRKHQQTKDKKNNISSNNSKINSLSGQVTNESKAARLSDNETFSLNAVNATDVIKELLGPRGDDPVAYAKMMKSIISTGKLRLKDLNMNKYDKQSIRTMVDFLTAAGLKVTF